MTKKTATEKESTLIKIIEAANKKLSKLHNKQKIVVGELACKYDLHKIDLEILKDKFKELAKELNVDSK